jgi:PKD repeat protein
VTSEIQAALDWWSAENPSADVTFTVDWNYRVPTSYEPINRPHTDQGLWIHEAMSYLGYTGVNYFTQVEGYVNALRNSTGTDWAFAMFIVDSSNDADGGFADSTSGGWKYFAYAYIGGPFLVMTYDNYNWGIGNMDRVTAHEMGHIFYATDEYDGEPDYSGYLNVLDVDGSGALMDDNTWWLSTGTMGQIGWRDTDGDGIQDIVDNYPNTILNPYSPDPTYTGTLTYSGSVTETLYPNNNPYGTGVDLTINTITLVQFRIDHGAWLDATAADGVFDEETESFTFTTPQLSVGTHTIETRGINSVGNAETSYSSDVVTIIGAPLANFVYSPENPVINETVTFDATSSAANGGAMVNYAWDFGDGHTATGMVVTHAYDSHGVFTATLNVTDIAGLWDTESKTVTVKSVPVANFTYSPETPYVGETVTFDAQTSYDLDGSITEYSWDFGDGNITSTADQVITHVYGEEDTYSVNLTVTDNDGLSNSTLKSVTTTMDFIPPTTIQDYDGSWRSTDFAINLEATDDFTGVAETYYKINEGPTRAVSVDGQPFITTQGDSNYLEYWSIDNAGNEELPHSILTDIKLDKTAPTGSITISNGEVYTTSTSVTLTLTAADTISGVYQVRFR